MAVFNVVTFLEALFWRFLVMVVLGCGYDVRGRFNVQSLEALDPSQKIHLAFLIVI